MARRFPRRRKKLKSRSWFDNVACFSYTCLMSVGNKSEEAILKFKMPFWAVMWMLIVGNVLGFGLLLSFVIEGRAHLTVSLQHLFIVVWISTLIGDILLGFICAAYFKVKLNPHGISCFYCWGIYSFVLWDEMREVKIFNLLGLKYIRGVFRNSRIQLWVPLFIKNRKGFSAALCEFAPVSNLLRQAFEQNG